MSSFTSKTVRDLYEAYDSVYIKEEEVFLNELLDEVTETINVLVDEGWDFSDHSWEEIYELFIDDVLNPELEEINSFFTSLNEEVLNGEEVENFIAERLGFLSGLSRFLPGAKKAQQAVTTATKSPKPSILQAPLVKPGAPAAAPATTKPQLSALGPGVKPVKPSTPLPTAQPQQGGIISQSWRAAQDWFGKLGKQPSATTQASVSSRLQAARQRLSQGSTTPAPVKPAAPSGTPKPSGYQPTNLRSTIRPALSTTRKTLGSLKAATYDKLPQVVRRTVKGTAIGTLAAPLVGMAGRDVYRSVSGGPSVTQATLGRAQQAYGTLEKAAGKVQGIFDPVGGSETVQSGRGWVRAGSETIADVERKESERKARLEKEKGTTTTTRRNLPPPSLTQSFEMEGELIDEAPKWPTNKPKSGDWSKLTLGGVTKIWDPETNSYQLPGTINKRLRAQGEKEITVPGKVSGYKPPKPAAQPPAAPAQPAPAAQPPAAEQPRQQPPRRQPAPPAQPSPVAKYMAAASAARKIQDPVQRAAEMEKVKQSGMEIWAKANPKLAAASAERQRIRGTAQTDNPLMKDMRSRLPLTPSVQAPDFQKTMSAGKYGAQGFQSLTQNPNAAIAATPKPAAKPVEQKPKPVNSSYEYEPYDLVLEYLLSEGHADTVEEAHYVMMQMDAEHIQDIVEMGDPSFPIKRSTGAGALTPDAAKQLGPKAVELQKQKAGQVALPKLPPA